MVWGLFFFFPPMISGFRDLGARVSQFGVGVGFCLVFFL